MRWNGLRSRGLWPAVALIVLAVAGGAVSAQGRGSAAALVVFADGESFSVVDGQGLTVAVDPADPIGIELIAGDTVLTESDTFLELQLVPSSNLVKIAENTNFTIDRRDSPRGGTFSLVYGKVRARVRSLTGEEQFVIRGDSAVAGVRGTDFGVSVVLPPEEQSPAAGPSGASAPMEEEPPQAVTEVYCFEGEVEVVAVEPPDRGVGVPRTEAGGPAPVIVRVNEFLAVTRASAPVQLDVEPLPEEVQSYWDANGFVAEPAAVSEAAQAEATGNAGSPAAQPTPPREEAPEERPPPRTATLTEDPLEALVRRARETRNEFRAASVLLLGLGAVMEIAGIADAALPSVDIFGDSGIGFVGVGAVFLTGGVFFAIRARRSDRQLDELESGGGSP